MSLEKLITEIASSHPVAVRAQRVTGITHRVGEVKQVANAAVDSADLANAEASRANAAVLDAAQAAQEAGEDARQAGADVVETIRRIEAGELQSYIDLTSYISQGKLAGQISGVYIEDLAVSRAKIADAAINSAKIANLAVNSQHVNELTANKLTSGDITASLITVSGRLEAGNGGVRLDGMGLGLTPLTDTGSAPADRPGRKITNQGASKWAALFPFQGGGVRGMGIRSDGASGGDNGRVELISTAFGDSTHSSTARVRVDAIAGTGAVLIEGNIVARNDLGVSGSMTTTGDLRTFNGDLYVPNGKIHPTIRVTGATATANGGWVSWNHGFGERPSRVNVLYQANGPWIDAGSAGSGIVWDMNNQRVMITNNRGAAVDLAYEIWR